MQLLYLSIGEIKLFVYKPNHSKKRGWDEASFQAAATFNLNEDLLICRESKQNLQVLCTQLAGGQQKQLSGTNLDSVESLWKLL